MPQHACDATVSRMLKHISTLILVLCVALVASLGAPSYAVAHNVCSLAGAVEEPCTYSAPPKPGQPASSRRWYTAGEHTPGYHGRVWYNYNPPCTQGACLIPNPFGGCDYYQLTPTPRAFPGSSDFLMPSGKYRLYCGQGTSSPVPHLHYREP